MLWLTKPENLKKSLVVLEQGFPTSSNWVDLRFCPSQNKDKILRINTRHNIILLAPSVDCLSRNKKPSKN